MLAALALVLDSANLPRDSEISFTSSQSLNDIEGCVIRKLAHRGTPLAIPVTGGVDIDLSEKTMLGIANEARYSLHIRDDGNVRTISVFYRHPYSAKYVYGVTKGIAKRCFASEFASVPKP